MQIRNERKNGCRKGKRWADVRGDGNIERVGRRQTGWTTEKARVKIGEIESKKEGEETSEGSAVRKGKR